MANQTITVDTNHDALTGRNAGENITINSGATLTVDSYPQETTMGLMGQTTITDGTWLIDGRNVKEIAYSSGSGSLPAVSDIITDSGGASGKVIKLTSGTVTSGVITITEQSGTFAASNTLTSGAFSATADSVKVGYLKYFAEDQNTSINGLSTMDFQGAWYELGTGDGNDLQSFTLPHIGLQCAIWIETGSGTGVYEKWFRINSTDTSLGDYGAGDLGKCFTHIVGTNVIDFGTSTNGDVPVSGAKVRIPNVHLGTATLAFPLVEIDVTSVSSGSLWGVGSNSSATIIMNKVNCSSVFGSYSGFDSVDITSSSVHVTSVNTFAACVSSVDLDDSVFSAFALSDMGFSSNIQVIDATNVTVNECLFNGRNNDPAIAFVTSSGITITGGKFITKDPLHTNANNKVQFNNTSNFTMDDALVIRSEINCTTGSSNGRFNNIGFSDGFGNSLSTANAISMIETSNGASDIIFNNFYFIAGGSPPYSYLAVFTDSNDCIFRNFGSIGSKVDCQNHTQALVNFAGLSIGCKIQRVWLNDTRLSDSMFVTPTCESLTVENCSVTYDRKNQFDCKTPMLRGLHACNGVMNSVQGFEVDYSLTIGYHIADLFTSDTQGRLHGVFSPPTADTAQYVTLTGTDIKFKKDGDLYIRDLGDFAEIETPYLIKGHTGFQNLDYVIQGSNTGNLDVEYAIDTGAGYGAYKDATGANLSGETILPTGFTIKFKVTCNSANIGNIIRGLYVSTTTTLLDQSNNFYPLDPVDITAPNVISGSRCQLYNVTKAVELDNSFAGVSGYSTIVNIGDGTIDIGDTVRFRAAYQAGVDARQELEVVSVMTATGLTFVQSQVNQAAYIQYGVDGSTITEFTWDNANIHVDINDADNTTEIQRIGSWYYAELMTEEGVRSLFGCINWESINSISIDSAECDLKIDNLKTDPLLLTGGRIYRTDGTTVIASTSNSIQIDYSPVYNSSIEDVWRVDIINGTYLGGSAGSVVKHIPRLINRKPDV